MLSRFSSSESFARTARPLIEGAGPLARRARSLAGHPSRLKIGAAAATLATAAGLATGAMGATPADAAVRTSGPVVTASAVTHAATTVSATKVPGQVLPAPVLAGPVLSGPVSSGPVLPGPVLSGPDLSGQAAPGQSSHQASPLNPASTQSSAGSPSPASMATPSTSSTPAATTQQTPASTPTASASASTQQGTSSAQPAQQHASAAPAAPAQPYVFYDSVTPGQIPSGHVVATYADGPFAASPSQVNHAKWVLWIDVNGSDPVNAQVLDVEPSDATPTAAAAWAHERLTAHPNGYAVIYTMRSEWPAVQAAIATLPSSMQSHVRYWIADPTGVPHVVPGSSATQWYWGTKFDVSTALPNF